MKKRRGYIFIFICFMTIILFSLTVYGQKEESHTHGTAIRTEQEFLQMQNGEKYYLENNITISESLIVNGEISLCLNGKVLCYQNDEKNNSIFHIQKDGILNIMDCSEETHTCKVQENGLWALYNNASEEDKKDNLKTVIGGLIIGGKGETRKIEELDASYDCGGFAYVEGGIVRIYGGNIAGNTAGFGGAVYLTENATLEIHGGKFCGNVSDYRGGAIFSQSGSVLMNDGTISENIANKNGGGINISGNSKLIMNGGYITENKASFWSGGIENFGTFEMNGGMISGNSASEDGGGVYNDGTFIMQSGIIKENIAKYGAGICNDKNFILHDGRILSNLAQESGGGIYNANTAEMYGGEIAGNIARTSGGGIENDGTFFMYDGIIGGTDVNDANSAYLGGGVCVYSGTFTMQGGKIEKNTGIDGGGVENEATFVMTGGIITQNFASVQGGGISNRGELVLSGNAEISKNGSGTNSTSDYKSGGVYWIVNETNSVLLGESVKIINNSTNGEPANMVIFGNGKISVLGLSETAHISFTLLNKNKTETAGTIIQYTDKETAFQNISCFSSDYSFYVIKEKGTEIKLSEQNVDLAITLLITVATIITVVASTITFIAYKKKKQY